MEHSIICFARHSPCRSFHLHGHQVEGQHLVGLSCRYLLGSHLTQFGNVLQFCIALGLQSSLLSLAAGPNHWLEDDLNTVVFLVIEDLVCMWSLVQGHDMRQHLHIKDVCISSPSYAKPLPGKTPHLCS